MAEKEKKGGLKSFGIGGLVGLISHMLLPVVTVATLALGAAAYSTVVAPVSYKILHSEATLGESYRNTLPRAFGYATGLGLPIGVEYVT